MSRIRLNLAPSAALEFRSRIRHAEPRPGGLPVEEWPATWVAVSFKELGGTRPLSLPPLTPSPVTRALKARRSGREFAGASLPTGAMSRLLACVTEGPAEGPATRNYPSAGGRYPVDVYLIARRVEGVDPGRYFFSPRDRSLRLLDGPLTDEEVELAFGEPWAAQAALIVVFVAQWGRSEVKYGDRATLFAAIEAGHIGQNLLLLSTELGFAACPMGGGSEWGLERLLHLVTPEETPLYAIAVGPVVSP